MPALYPLFYNNLQDNIASVRQGAALALANVVTVYGKPVSYKTAVRFIIPPAMKLGGGVYWNHPVRPSVCLSVRL